MAQDNTQSETQPNQANQEKQRVGFWQPTWRKSLTVIAVSALIVVTSFVLWATATKPIMPEAEQALISSEGVLVFNNGSYITFVPMTSLDAPLDRGYILYPGGRVAAEAYAPIAQAIAEEGYFVAIVYAPLNLAFFGVGAADGVIENNPDVEYWAVGGHSLGGVAASLYATQNEDVDGLIIMASYPANDALKGRTDLAVTSIYATEDGLARAEDIIASADELPEDTQFVAIEGGNHAYFGYYGAQDGDNPATITRQEFMDVLIPATINLLERMGAS
jgi:hypothetical protein